jgi:hypothetical protein
MPTFAFVPAGSQQHVDDWASLSTSRGDAAFVHSVAWARARARPLDRWCRVLDDAGRLVTGAVIAIDRSRKLPWIQLARIPQATALLEACMPAQFGRFAEALCASAPRVARLTVQAYSADQASLTAQGAVLRAAGFEEEPSPRQYEHTLLLPLEGNRETLHARLSASARRNIRQVAESGFAVRPITDAAYAPRLAWLLQAAHHRTGGRAGGDELAAMIRAAVDDPHTSVLLGVFHPTRHGTDALIGFAQGTLAPAAATYAVAGTERASDIGRMPISYALLWELIDWGRERSAPWFDFGGVTPEADTQHPLAGISSFKRKFGGRDSAVAAEFSLVTNPMQHRLLHAGALVVRQLRRRR